MGAVDALGTVAAVGTSMAIQAANPVGTVAQIAAASGKFQGQSQPVVIVNGTQPATGDKKKAKTPLVKDQAAADKAAKAKDEGLGKLRGMFAFKAAGKQAAKKETKQDATEKPASTDTTETPASTDAKTDAAPAAEKLTTEDPTAAKTTTDKAIETKPSERKASLRKAIALLRRPGPHAIEHSTRKIRHLRT